MQAGDMVYYLHTDKNGTDIKFRRFDNLSSDDDDGYLIRIGKLDVHAQKIVTFESTVAVEKLLASLDTL